MSRKPIKKVSFDPCFLLNVMSAKGYTRQSLAKEIGCNEKTIRRDILNCEMNPNRMRQIEDILGVRFDPPVSTPPVVYENKSLEEKIDDLNLLVEYLLECMFIRENVEDKKCIVCDDMMFIHYIGSRKECIDYVKRKIIREAI